MTKSELAAHWRKDAQAKRDEANTHGPQCDRFYILFAMAAALEMCAVQLTLLH